MLKNTNICNNCGKQGHQFHQCKLPITSYGIILFRITSKGLQYLMIRRKDSFGYIDFIRGKYAPYNIHQLTTAINEMSTSEKERILKYSFDKLWIDMWGDECYSQYRNEESISSKKFEIIKNGISINNKIIDLKMLVEQSKTNWTETEWEFPKGRRDYKERDLDCALREFVEETGFSVDKIKIIENVTPFEEIFMGTNHKSYKHKYFLACLDDVINDPDNNKLTNYQKSEVSKIEWKSIDECLSSIRPYNLEKKKLITTIDRILGEYSCFSSI